MKVLVYVCILLRCYSTQDASIKLRRNLAACRTCLHHWSVADSKSILKTIPADKYPNAEAMNPNQVEFIILDEIRALLYRMMRISFISYRLFGDLICFHTGLVRNRLPVCIPLSPTNLLPTCHLFQKQLPPLFSLTIQSLTCHSFIS